MAGTRWFTALDPNSPDLMQIIRKGKPHKWCWESPERRGTTVAGMTINHESPLRQFREVRREESDRTAASQWDGDRTCRRSATTWTSSIIQGHAAGCASCDIIRTDVRTAICPTTPSSSSGRESAECHAGAGAAAAAAATDAVDATTDATMDRRAQQGNGYRPSYTMYCRRVFRPNWALYSLRQNRALHGNEVLLPVRVLLQWRAHHHCRALRWNVAQQPAGMRRLPRATTFLLNAVQLWIKSPQGWSNRQRLQEWCLQKATACPLNKRGQVRIYRTMTDRGQDSTLSEEMALKLGKLGARPLHGRVFFDSWEVADDIGCRRFSRILCYVGVCWCKTCQCLYLQAAEWTELVSPTRNLHF